MTDKFPRTQVIYHHRWYRRYAYIIKIVWLSIIYRIGIVNSLAALRGERDYTSWKVAHLLPLIACFAFPQTVHKCICIAALWLPPSLYNVLKNEIIWSEGVGGRSLFILIRIVFLINYFWRTSIVRALFLCILFIQFRVSCAVISFRMKYRSKKLFTVSSASPSVSPRWTALTFSPVSHVLCVHPLPMWANVSFARCYLLRFFLGVLLWDFDTVTLLLRNCIYEENQ